MSVDIEDKIDIVSQIKNPVVQRKPVDDYEDENFDEEELEDEYSEQIEQPSQPRQDKPPVAKNFQHAIREHPAMLRKRQGENFPESEFELEGRFITPEAKMYFPEITRDVRTSNYSERDIDLIMDVGEIIRFIEGIEDEHFEQGDLSRPLRLFFSDLQYIANTRAAYKGFIPQLAKTQRMENVPIMPLDQPYEGGNNPGSIQSVLKGIRGGNKKSQPII